MSRILGALAPKADRRPAPRSAQVHVGRQPIYDGEGRLAGYELLFRDASTATRADLNGDSATTAVITATFADFGLQQIVGTHPCFINLTRAFLVGALPIPFPPEQAVLEILETIEVDDEVLAGLRRLREQGYKIALDDFVWTPERDALVDLAHVVKVDVLGTDPAVVAETAERCRGRGVALLAERVEDAEVLEHCRSLGFTLFQGYHLGRPQTLSRASLTPSGINAMRLLSVLARPDVDVEEVERMVRMDPALTYRLLRIVNSAAIGLSRRLTTVREALVLVGLGRLQGWIMLLSLSDVGASEAQLEQAVTRARMCELVAAEVPGAMSGTAFMVGLVHGLRDTLGLSSAEITEELGLEPTLLLALEGTGALGTVLMAVLAHERQDPAGVAATGLDVTAVSRAHLSAVGWATLTGQTVNAASQPEPAGAH